MGTDDLDMEGFAIDRAMRLAAEIVHDRTSTRAAFAGIWVDMQAREVHVAHTGPNAAGQAAELQRLVPPEIRVRSHEARHSLADLEALRVAVGRYLDEAGVMRLHGVDVGVRVAENRVRLNLKETTPPEVVDRVRAEFPTSALQIELTTARWTIH